MPTNLSDYTDEQLRTFLSRVSSRDLIALMVTLPPHDQNRILSLVSHHSADLMRDAMEGSSEGHVSTAERILEEVVENSERCTFCRIFDGELSGSYVYSDDLIAVIMDLYPVTPGHALVIPRTHTAFLPEVEPSAAAALMNKAQELGSVMLSSELDADGFNLHLANGGAANQDVFHVHLHVIPRYFGDGFGFTFPPGYPNEAARALLDSQADMLRQNFTSR